MNRDWGSTAGEFAGGTFSAVGRIVDMSSDYIRFLPRIICFSVVKLDEFKYEAEDTMLLLDNNYQGHRRIDMGLSGSATLKQRTKMAWTALT